MKRIVHLILLGCISIPMQAQFQLGFNYSMAVPLGEMAENINLTHSGVLDFKYHFKGKAKNLWAGVQGSLGVYASRVEEQLYTFSDGSTTEVDVHFTSNIANGHIQAGYDLLSNKAVTPYLTAKTGFSKFLSTVNIPDPNDDDGCHPLENKNVYKDNVITTGLGAGALIKGDKLFKKIASDNWSIDISANYLMGGDVKYLNVKHIQHHTDNTTQDPKQFNVQFVNVSTNEIHSHQVAEVFSSKVRQLYFKIGLIWHVRG